MTKRNFPQDDELPRRGAFRDPAAPNPYNLPDDDMHPKRVPSREDVERRGGTYLQAKETAQLPNALLRTWPPRLIDELYAYCWRNHHGGGDLYALVAQLEDHELESVVVEVESFKRSGGQFHPVGTKLFDGLMTEAKKRDAKRRAPDERASRLPMRHVKVDARPVEEERPVVHLLPASTDKHRS